MVRRYCSIFGLFLMLSILVMPVGATNGFSSWERAFKTAQLPPIYNATWRSSLDGYDIAISDDGSVYTVGQLGSAHEGTAILQLLKWTPEATLVWNKTWNGARGGLEVKVSPDGHIYTLGQGYNGSHEGMVIAKWSTDGSRVWNKTWYGPSYEARAQRLAVDNEGNLFIGGLANLKFKMSILDTPLFVIYRTPCLAKWSSDGNLIWYWNQTIREDPIIITGDPEPNSTVLVYDGSLVGSIATGPAGAVYCYHAHNLTKWDLQGNFIWTRYCGHQHINDLKTDYDGMIYGAGQVTGPSRLMVQKWTPNGDEVWKSSFPENYSYPFDFYNVGTAIALSEDSVYTGGHDSLDGLLVKWDLQGNRIWNMTWRWSGPVGGVEVGPNKLVYILTMRSLLVFQDGNITDGFGGFYLYLMIGGGGLLVIIAIVLLVKRRKPVT